MPVFYEGFFIDNETAEEAFRRVRGERPYPETPKDYHVTTEFHPEPPHKELYGTPVRVEVLCYKNDRNLKNRDGKTAMNEGFSVRVTSDDPAVQKLIDDLTAQGKNWHITGSFLHPGDAICTGDIDFTTDAVPCDFVFDGVYRGIEGKMPPGPPPRRDFRR